MSYFEIDDIKAGLPHTPESRLIQLAEECSELAKACLKIVRRMNGDKSVDILKAYDNLLEEIADVEIVVEQLKHKMTSNNLRGIEESKQAKLAREQQRLMSDVD